MFKYMIIVISSIVWLISCIPSGKKTDTKQILYRTGETIAVDHLIQKFENEHQMFYKEEIRSGNLLEWPDLNNKNLSNYCRKYLQLSVPQRNTDGATGKKIIRTLHYKKGNKISTSEVVVVRCKVMNKQHPYIYYITRAPNPHCVYALKSTVSWKKVILTIINRYCDFENLPPINRVLKWNGIEVVHKVHRSTSQPIAKDEYLLKYELEHQELLKREGNNGIFIGWPYAIIHPSLDSYCYQYLGESAPNRYREGVKGSYKSVKLHYQKLNITKYVTVITVVCQSANLSKVCYYIARAPEINCVYALLRPNHNSHTPMEIVFKHCDFEAPIEEQAILKDNEILKTKAKEEILDAVESMIFFP